MKFKKIISLIIALILSISLGIPVAACKKLSDEMSLEDLEKFAKKNTYSYKIYEYEMQNAKMSAKQAEAELQYYEQLLKKTPKYKSEYYEYTLKVAELKKKSELANMEKKYYEENKEEIDQKQLNLTIKSKYYELCGLKKQADVLSANTSYLKKYAKIESVRLENGQSTEINLKLAQSNLKVAQNELATAEKAVEIKIKEIAEYINQYENTESFSINCRLPENISFHDFDEKKLYKKFCENNYELQKQQKSMKFDEDYLEEIKNIYGNESDTYKSYSNLYEIDKLNFEIKENGYKSQISAMLSEYKMKFSEYEACVEYNDILNDKLIILKKTYTSGNISELEYLRQYAEIYSETVKVDHILMEVDLMYDKINLVAEGIGLE